jgi:hypothetical protein
MPGTSLPPGKGGGLIIQLLGTSQTLFVPLATLRFTHDARLGESTESDDIGAVFSASGAPLAQSEIVLHRRNEGYPELIGLIPGVQIYRIWHILGGARVGNTPVPKAHLVAGSTVATMSEDIQEIAPNMPAAIQIQGGAIWRHVNLPALNTVIAATPILPSGS